MLPKKSEDSFFLFALLPIPLFPFFIFQLKEGEECNKKRERRGRGQVLFHCHKKNTETVHLEKKNFKPQIRMTPHVTSITTYFMAILKGNHRGWNMSREERFFSFILSHSSEQWLQSFAEAESQAKHAGAVNLMNRSDTERLPRADHLGLQDFSLQMHHNT